MYTKKGSPYSENFIPSDHLTETKEVLFPITEKQTPAYAAVIPVTINEMGTQVDVDTLTGDATINLTIDDQVSDGAEILLQLTADGSARTVTLGTGLSGASIVIPPTETVQSVLKYDGTNFRFIASSNASVANGTITAAKLAADAVETLKIKDANVTHAKLADDAVETVNIKDANVTHAKLADDSVETVNIKDANVTAAKLATDAVETLKIKDANVTHAKLADDAVETVNIKDDNVTADKLAADSVITVKIADDAVTTAKIDDGAVTDVKIALLAVDTAQIAAKAVETAKIDDLAVTAAQIAADAVETAKIKDANVTLAKLAVATKGDIMYYNSGWQVLPIGTSGQTLKVSSGGIPEWTT